MTFQEGCTAQVIKDLKREQGDPTGLEQELPCSVPQVSETGSLHLLRDVGSSIAASFSGFRQSSATNCSPSSETDLGFTRPISALQQSLFPSHLHLPPGPDQQSLSLHSAKRGKEVPQLPHRGLNTHCALGVSKSPSSHGSMCLLQSPLTWQSHTPHPIMMRYFWDKVSKIQRSS